MKYRFLLHNLAHTVLAVNIAGLSVNIAGVGVNGHSLPFIRFRSDQAERHFSELGAGQSLSMSHSSISGGQALLY
jgi:hypothetical protein